MIVLSQSAEDHGRRGFTPARQAEALRRVRDRHGMPIDAGERPRLSASIAACRAVVAAGLHVPARERPLLRAFRIRHMRGELTDVSATQVGAAVDAGIDPHDLASWLADPAVERALRADRSDARSPLPAALALDHKLAGPPGQRRYTAPTLEFTAEDGRAVVVPGFNPAEAYDVVVAHLEPALRRRPAPDGVEEVLRWAAEPLATAEVAALLSVGLDEARGRLAAGADFEPLGQDGFWSARGRNARSAA